MNANIAPDAIRAILPDGTLGTCDGSLDFSCDIVVAHDRSFAELLLYGVGTSSYGKIKF